MKTKIKLKGYRIKNIKAWKMFIFLLAVFVAFIALFLYLLEKPEEKAIYVLEVIDGDTFKLSSGEIVRLLCVDTPEKGDRGYEDAKEFLAGKLLLEKINAIAKEQIN